MFTIEPTNARDIMSSGGNDANAGLLNDSDLHEDSIFYNGYSENTRLSRIDELVIRILYNSGVKSGMKG